jgi:hypothetical protein
VGGNIGYARVLGNIQHWSVFSILTFRYLNDSLISNLPVVLYYSVATKKLTMTQNPTAHAVYKYMKQINTQLKNVLGSRPANLIDLIRPMQDKYNKYREKMKDFSAISLVFDPRCKLVMIEFLLKDELGNNQAAASIAAIKKNLSSWFNDFISNTPKRTDVVESTDIIQKQSNKPKSVIAEDNVDLCFKRYLSKIQSTQAISTTAELNMYLQEPPVTINSPNFSILAWWSTHDGQFLNISKLAKMILMVLMTSIASEAAFSTSGRVLNNY